MSDTVYCIFYEESSWDSSTRDLMGIFLTYDDAEKALEAHKEKIKKLRDRQIEVAAERRRLLDRGDKKGVQQLDGQWLLECDGCDSITNYEDHEDSWKIRPVELEKIHLSGW